MKRNKPLRPEGAPRLGDTYTDWRDFTDRVARPWIESDDDERGANWYHALMMERGMWYLACALVFADNRIRALEQSPMTVDEARNQPGAFTAYRRTDGDLIYGEFSWIADHHECGHWNGDEPDEIEEVVMVPVRVRVYPCHEPEEPEEDE